MFTVVDDFSIHALSYSYSLLLWQPHVERESPVLGLLWVANVVVTLNDKIQVAD